MTVLKSGFYSQINYLKSWKQQYFYHTDVKTSKSNKHTKTTMSASKKIKSYSTGKKYSNKTSKFPITLCWNYWQGNILSYQHPWRKFNAHSQIIPLRLSKVSSQSLTIFSLSFLAMFVYILNTLIFIWFGY